MKRKRVITPETLEPYLILCAELVNEEGPVMQPWLDRLEAEYAKAKAHREAGKQVDRIKALIAGTSIQQRRIGPWLTKNASLSSRRISRPTTLSELPGGPHGKSRDRDLVEAQRALNYFAHERCEEGFLP